MSPAQVSTVRFTIDETLQAAVRAVQFEPEQQNVTIVGRPHLGDFSPAGLRRRIDTYAGSVLCDFTSDLRDAVLDAMDEMVMAEGRAELELNGASVHVLHLGGLEALSSAKPRSLDNLAHEQQVQPLSSLAELTGPPVDDFDEFLIAIKSARSDDEQNM